MAHEHQVKDVDLHFIIDPITRTIKNNSGKIVLMQYDHQSEVFTFEIPRYIDTHDMSVCNEVRIHYINIGSSSNQTPICGVYEISDLQVDPDNNERVICSWLLTNQTTQLEGTLSFIIRFSCVTGVTIDYSWSTAIYSGIVISKSINNSEIVIENTIDILEQWKNSIKEDIASDLEVSAKTLGISGASSGQIPVIKSIGKTGEPIEWEPADIPEQVQGDWNQNDEAQPDYIKNRTHYEAIEESVIFSSSVTFVKYTDQSPYVATYQSDSIGNVDNDYRIVIKDSNGEIVGDYTYSPVLSGEGDNSVIMLGDTSEIQTSVPISQSNPNFNNRSFNTFQKFTNSDICNITIYEKSLVVKQLDPKYIKDMYYTGDPVETVLLEETTVSFSKNRQVYIGRISPYTGFFPDEGKIYNVNWDGSIYQCTCYLDGSIPTLGVLGNPDPFSIAFLADSSSLGIATKTANSHTISISGFIDKIVKIDPKYIPADAFDNVLYVTLTPGEGDTITADKTFAEITEAVGSGMCVIAQIPSGAVLYLSSYGGTYADFLLNNGTQTIHIYCDSSDTWSFGSYILTASDVGAIPSPATAAVGQTIVVKAVDGSGVPTEWEVVDMPSDDHINELIDTKLGAIENGTY